MKAFFFLQNAIRYLVVVNTITGGLCVRAGSHLRGEGETERRRLDEKSLPTAALLAFAGFATPRDAASSRDIYIYYMLPESLHDPFQVI